MPCAADPAAHCVDAAQTHAPHMRCWRRAEAQEAGFKPNRVESTIRTWAVCLLHALAQHVQACPTAASNVDSPLLLTQRCGAGQGHTRCDHRAQTRSPAASSWETQSCVAAGGSSAASRALPGRQCPGSAPGQGGAIGVRYMGRVGRLEGLFMDSVIRQSQGEHCVLDTAGCRLGMKPGNPGDNNGSCGYCVPLASPQTCGRRSGRARWLCLAAAWLVPP